MELTATDLAAAGRRVIDEGYRLSRAEALQLCDPGIDVHDLLYWGRKIRAHYRGDKVSACSIISARTGSCSENCHFCAQSAHWETAVAASGFLPAGTIRAAAEHAAQDQSAALGVVTSGNRPSKADMEKLVEYLDAMGGTGVEKHIDAGLLRAEEVARLKAHGMSCCGHNLETSRRHFPKICTTHTYDQRLETLRELNRQNVRICSGGIFGMGETWEDRVDLALELREIGAANVPMNFLNAIPGTPLAHLPPLKPLEILRIIAVYRFILFDRDICVYGGREKHLRDLQALIFMAGANGLILGNYLTTPGRPAEADRQMIQDLELNLAPPCDE